MIRPVHREMVLRMAGRGLPPSAIHEAMGRSLPLDLIREIVADGGTAQRRQAVALRQDRHQTRLTNRERGQKRADLERRLLFATLGYRVTVIRAPRRAKSRKA